jgi:hypothetical protein
MCMLLIAVLAVIWNLLGGPYLRFSSFDNSARNSASARLPANCAAVSDWYPSPVILMPNGLLLRHISQPQRSGCWPRREVTT